MSGLDGFGGALRVQPGRPRPHNLHSTRPELVGRLATGLPADRLPAVLGSLFSLCGHAHRLCAGMAVDAACGAPCDADDGSLERETLREHLRRIWLDWPRLLGGGPVDLGLLSRCPAHGVTGPWLAQAVFGVPASHWLRAWVADPAAWLSDWAASHDTLPARLLHAVRDLAQVPIEAAPALRVDDAVADAPRETGPWTRLHTTEPPPADAWQRLGSRLAEIARLSVGQQALDRGARLRADGEAVAWVEMARGLLIHRLRLDADGRVAACRVFAPTDWNFHPDGAVARALESMSPCDERRVGVLMAAYDPCVPYVIDQPREAAHA